MPERREPHVWRAQEAAHYARVDDLTGDHRDRARRGQAHPVVDFLFTYYRFRPRQLRRWHPGPGVTLAHSPGEPPVQAAWRHYAAEAGGVRLDVASFLRARGESLMHVHRLLVATAARSPHFGCFGLHEWAMVHGLERSDVRHAGWPLRLTPERTDAVAAARPFRCTHYDAYRFFTPSARGFNTEKPTRERRVELEQPGCLHANMDLYKYAFALAPGVPSELTLEAFELALAARELDMRAAPYDLRALGYEPVRVETPEGRSVYVEEQRRLADRAAGVRSRLVTACARLLAAA